MSSVDRSCMNFKRSAAQPSLMSICFFVACRLSSGAENVTKLPSFSFEEIRTLSTEAELPKPLADKLDLLLNSVETGSFSDKTKPARPVEKGMPLLRATMWNIERGQEFDSIVTALSRPREFYKLSAKRGLKPERLSVIKKEADLLMQSDLLILNELDEGMKRSDYRDVARELASALHMNYAYAVEFVEVDPVALGVADIGESPLEDELKEDPAKYKGLHGSAILSRYPLKDTKILRLPVCHDWYADEKKPVPRIEKAKRLGSERVFLEAIAQERRRGGRIALLANLQVPGVPGGAITVVNAHLENKCRARCRVEQMNYILDKVKDTQGPLIMAGDMNTTGADGSILSFGYILKTKMRDPRFWGGQLVSYMNPLNLYGAGAGLRYLRGYQDPTGRDIPVLANNREYALFNTIRKHQFTDGTAFDFGGEKEFTVNGAKGTLANSNQRSAKGFAYTFSLPRDFKGAVGRYRLDWFFIKPPAGQDNSRVLRPQYPRTMQALTQALEPRLSDHAPITVDLPLGGGSLTNKPGR